LRGPDTMGRKAVRTWLLVVLLSLQLLALGDCFRIRPGPLRGIPRSSSVTRMPLMPSSFVVERSGENESPPSCASVEDRRPRGDVAGMPRVMRVVVDEVVKIAVPSSLLVLLGVLLSPDSSACESPQLSSRRLNSHPQAC
jgi:hypothetical protein